MIEVTDEQVRVFKDTYNLLAGHCDFESVRAALEAYEQSKWIKFDVNNESTYPKVEDVSTTILGITDLKDTLCLTDFYSNINPNVFDGKPFILFDRGYSDTDLDAYYGTAEVSSKHLVAWQPLPKFKE